MTEASAGMDRQLAFHPLAFHADGDEVVVARTDAQTYHVLPADGAALLQRLQGGATLGGAATWYAEEYGEAVDIEQFAAALDELGFLRTAADPAAPLHDPAAPIPWQRLARAVLSVPGAVVWALLVVSAVAIAALHSRYIPARGDVFFTRSLVVIELTILVGQVPLSLLHELGHFLAGRRLGVASRVRVSHRLTVVVFETVLDGLVMLPRRRRYLPLVVGVLVDIMVMAVLVDAAWCLHLADPDDRLGVSVCLAFAFTTLPRILWQFFVFLRTDFYFVLANALHCDDLDAAARDVIRNRWRRRAGRLDDLVPRSSRPETEWRAARAFAPFLVGGYAVAIGTAALVATPLAWAFVERLIHGLLGGGTLRWDALGILALNLGEPVAAGLLERREARQRRNRGRTGACRPDLARLVNDPHPRRRPTPSAPHDLLSLPNHQPS